MSARITRPDVLSAPRTAGSLISGSRVGCVYAVHYARCHGACARRQSKVPCCRGDFGRLGHGDCSDVFLPRQISAFTGIRIVRIAGGDTHSLVVCAACRAGFPTSTGVAST